MNDIVFSKSWFEKHQRMLLLLANSSVGRYILRIHGNRSSVGRGKIVKIEPHAITWKSGNQLKTEIRTHDKFAKRVYYSFKPFWHLIHSWDQIANALNQPSWNLGFDTLTAYPVAGANAPADGYIERNLGAVSGNSFSDLVTGAGTGNSETPGADRVGSVTAGTTTDMFRRILRAGFGFDTSSIGDSDTIDAVVFSLSPSGKANGLGEPDLSVCDFTPANEANFANTDYANFGSVSFGSITYSAWTADGGYDHITLNSDGRANINKTGNTFYGTRVSWDLSGTFGGSWSSVGDTNFQSIHADFTGTSRDPKLVVTYTPAGTAHTKNLSDSLTVSDSVVKSLVRTLVDTITPTDNTITKTITKARSDTININENFSKSIVFAVNFSDTVTMSEALARLKTQYREFSDSLTMGDSIVKSTSRTLSDSTTLSEDLFVAIALIKNLSDSITINETIAKTTGKVNSETVTLIEDYRKSTVRIVVDSITMSDAFSRILQKTQELSDNMTIGDSLSKYTQRTLNDTFTLTEIFSSVATLFKSLSDSITMSDSITKIKSAVKVLTDSVTLSSTLSRSVTKVYRESIEIRDKIIRALNGVVILWRIRTKVTSVWTKRGKVNDTDWTPRPKINSIWTRRPKP